MLTHKERRQSLAHGLGDKERAVIETAHFFEPYKHELRSLFVALGREHEWSDDPRNMLPYLREKWIGIEHGNHVTKDQFSDEQIAAAQPWLEALGLKAVQVPSRNAHFDQAIIVGGTMLSNYRRVEFVHAIIDSGVQINKLIFWVGNRPRERRDGSISELLSTHGRFAGLGVRGNAWVKDLIVRGTNHLRRRVHLNETDLGRFALLKVLDNKMMPYRIDLSILNERHRRADLLDKIESLPERYVKDYYFKTDEGLDIVLLNGSPVSRGVGANGKPRPARHTTASCTIEWLERHAPAQNARILYITGNPHTLRTAQDTYAILKEEGRDDLQFTVAGTAPSSSVAIQTYLGEIARLIDNDIRRNYSNAWGGLY